MVDYQPEEPEFPDGLEPSGSEDDSPLPKSKQLAGSLEPMPQFEGYEPESGDDARWNVQWEALL